MKNSTAPRRAARAAVSPAVVRSAVVLLAAALVPAACAEAPESAPPGEVTGFDEQPLGEVHLAASCGPAADSSLERGLALLHHMTYGPAETAFAEAAAADSGCALAWWGRAMSHVHPLWSDPPSAENFQRGASFVATARALDGLSDVEAAYVEAVGTYYDVGDGAAERPNLEAFAAGWEAAHERFPDDPEITAFHALSLLGTVDPADKSYAVQRRAGGLAEQLLAAYPDHPGAHHYVIHAYDVPGLAERALAAARSYGDVAPAVSHSLHMPSHIFTRLGLWEASIEMNDRSARAARGHLVGDQVSLHFHHALDYLAYAHLQRAQWADAHAVLDTLEGLGNPPMREIAVAYTLAAVPARIALERGAWATAAALPARVPADYPWDEYPAMEAITHFARGIGAARAGDAAAARATAERLSELREAAGGRSSYWGTQVEVQRLAVSAWGAHAAGDRSTALRLMNEAARLEASTEKHPVTPGEIAPAQELLGEMLLELERYPEAGEAFAGALQRSPRRLRSLYGAGRAAEHAGDTAAALGWYREVVELTADGDPETEAVRHAQGFVERA